MAKKDSIKKPSNTLRKQAVKRLQEQSTDQNNISPKQARHTLHELHVHQIELEMQSEELHKTQAELEVSRNKYFDLYNFAPVGYLTLDKEGLIKEANLTATQLLGVERSFVVKQSINHFIYRDDRDIHYLHLKKLFDTGIPQDCELRLVKKDGSQFWVNMKTTATQKDESGSVVYQTALIDITNKKSEAKYRFLTENMNDVVWTADLDLNVTYDSPVVERVLGYTPEERMGQKAIAMLTPGSYARALEVLDAELKRDQEEGVDPDRTIKLELEYYHKNGSIVWMECVVSAIRDDSGKIIGIHGVSRDITDRRHAESAMRESDKRFRSLIQNSLDMIIIMDREGAITYESPSIERILGYSPGYHIGKSPLDLIHPDDLEFASNGLKQVYLKTNPGIPIEFRFKKANNTWVYLEAIGQNLFDDSVINGVVITVRDISERRHQEEALRESEQRFSTIFKHAADGILLVDIATKKFYMGNNQICKALGYSAEEIKNMTVMDIHSEKDLPHVLDQIKKKVSKEITISKDIPVKRKDGSIFYADVNSFPIDLMGKTFLLSIFRDITDRRQAEEELKTHHDHLEDLVRERTANLIQANERLKQEFEKRKRSEDVLRASEAKYRRLYEGMIDAFVSVDMTGKIKEYNKSYQDMLGYSSEELGSLTYKDLTPEQWHAFEDSIIQKQVLPRGYSDVYEKEYQRKDGTVFPVELRAILVRDDAGEPSSMWAIIRDITIRKHTEQALNTSEARLRSIFEHSMVGILFSTPDGRIFSANPTACLLLGRNEEEVIIVGRDSLIDRKDPRVREILKVRNKQGYAVGEMNVIRADGTLFPAQVSSNVFETNEGPRACIVFQDISEMKKAEERIRNFSRKLLAVREEEKHRLSAILHHDVGSLTVGIGVCLNAVEEDLIANKYTDALASLKECRNLFEGSVKQLKMLSVELRPPELDILGLRVVLRQHIKKITHDTSLKIHFIDATHRVTIPYEIQTTLFRVAQECLTNVIKHAQAQQVLVRLSAPKQQLRLILTDNGKGFDPAQSAARQDRPLGLTAMQEMISDLGGMLKVLSTPGKGVKVTVSIPTNRVKSVGREPQ